MEKTRTFQNIFRFSGLSSAIKAHAALCGANVSASLTPNVKTASGATEHIVEVAAIDYDSASTTLKRAGLILGELDLRS